MANDLAVDTVARVPQTIELEHDQARWLLAAIVDSTEDAVVSADLDGVVTSWNLGAETLYGYTAEEAIGRPVSMLWSPEQSIDDVLRCIAAGDRVAHSEITRMRSDGSAVMVGETTSPVLDHEGHVVGMATISRDISDRLRSAQELEESREALEVESTRLKQSNFELEQFAYVASHDLSEPLRAVAGMVTLLERRYADSLDDDAHEFIQFAVDGCTRMRSMIDDLLRYSRAGRAEVERTEVDMGELVEESLAALSDQIRREAADVQVAELPTVSGDRAQLAQVWQNLLGNTLKFRSPDRPPVIRVTAAEEGTSTRFEVADNGIGIDDRYREKVFGMFQRLHTADVYEGTGMGLSLAQRIVSRHGGTMSVGDSRLGGTAISFTVAHDPEEGAG